MKTIFCLLAMALGDDSSGLKLRKSEVTILHISDTHSLHRAVQLPKADILIHSGDVSQVGSDAEVRDFNDWLGSLKGNFKEIFVISGNHDYWDTNERLRRGALAEAAAQSPEYFQRKITNARVLNHELVEVMGLRIWGAGWSPNRGDSFSGNGYEDVPADVDVLVTHDAPRGIFDSVGGGHWGSSQQLLQAIYRSKAKVHLFGHIHEQRGHWEKSGGHFEGGVLYRPDPSKAQVFQPNGPPPSDYPVQLESNNALANNPAVDHSWTGIWAPQHLVGRPRMIKARREAGQWSFTSQVV